MIPLMSDEDIRRQLMALDCDMHITRILLCELIAQSPSPQALLQRFQAAIDAMTAQAPHDMDLEQLVELRARAAQTVQIVRQELKQRASSASPRSRPRRRR